MVYYEWYTVLFYLRIIFAKDALSAQENEVISDNGF